MEDIEDNEYIEATEDIDDNYTFFYALTTLVLILILLPSTFCLIIHFYKYFRSTTPVLATKNLTLYCFFLVLYYPIILLKVGEEMPYLYAYAQCYLSLTVSFLKLLIALDVCLCFRNIALYLQHPAGSENKKFFIYCSLGSTAPLLFILLCALFWERHDLYVEIFAKTYLEDIITIIRISRLIPIILAFWYIRSASIDKSELWSKFSLHIRLLIMLGGFSAVFSALQLHAMIISDEENISFYSKKTQLMLSITIQSSTIDPGAEKLFSKIQDLGTVLEGLAIAIFFTFKKDTFRSTNSHTQTSG